jgi:hypothetical protein
MVSFITATKVITSRIRAVPNDSQAARKRRRNNKARWILHRRRRDARQIEVGPALPLSLDHGARSELSFSHRAATSSIFRARSLGVSMPFWNRMLAKAAIQRS